MEEAMLLLIIVAFALPFIGDKTPEHKTWKEIDNEIKTKK
jgi:hypothetical protein